MASPSARISSIPKMLNLRSCSSWTKATTSSSISTSRVYSLRRRSRMSQSRTARQRQSVSAYANDHLIISAKGKICS
ncbi:377f0161-5c35-4cad-bbf5-2aa1aa2f21f8 [Sclerotinia trifoliorum]|uniref:377f0161-5c35-4cad-bbf5-2aa1aa2f21f8 n=1 Tax=Sclerotinia trifoliorum TaxID=28548 RepID=A0A8H2VQA7_9HELO|nr:377f0161-5c35-4cad-bbf5-2aa1aa2f21f8 [Sclerotinia trifoliorum]